MNDDDSKKEDGIMTTTIVNFTDTATGILFKLTLVTSCSDRADITFNTKRPIPVTRCINFWVN